MGLFLREREREKERERERDRERDFCDFTFYHTFAIICPTPISMLHVYAFHSTAKVVIHNIHMKQHMSYPRIQN